MYHKCLTKKKDMSEKTPFLQLDSFKGAEFNIEGKTKSYSIMEMLKLKDFIDSHLKMCAYHWRDLNYYKDYDEAKVEQYLSEQEEGQTQAQEYLNQDEEIEYSLGDNFAKFLETSNGRFVDNNEAAKIIKKEYTEKFGENTLVFDPEMSHCYVYTKDREEAKRFLLFVYNKHIKPYLEPWYKGWDDFVKDFKNASELDKQKFDNLNW